MIEYIPVYVEHCFLSYKYKFSNACVFKTIFHNFICSYTGYMQQGIKRDPTLVIKLRATFLKVTFQFHKYDV